MKSTDAVLGGMLVVLAVIAIYQSRSLSGFGSQGRADRFLAPSTSGAASCQTAPGTVHTRYPGGFHNPYTVLNKQIGELRGYRNDGYNQPPLWNQPHGLDRYHRAGAYLKPRDIARAEREAWYSAAEGDCASGTFNTEKMTNPADDVMQYHAPQPALDYNTFVTDLIADPRVRDNHRRWVEEMKPWSGTSMKVDDMDEAMEATTDFIGLRRPQSVSQYNPLQLTERDTMTFIGNSKFLFQG